MGLYGIDITRYFWYEIAFTLFSQWERNAAANSGWWNLFTDNNIFADKRGLSCSISGQFHKHLWTSLNFFLILISFYTIFLIMDC